MMDGNHARLLLDGSVASDTFLLLAERYRDKKAFEIIAYISKY